MVVTSYHNILTDFISPWQWVEVKCHTSTITLSFCQKIERKHNQNRCSHNLMIATHKASDLHFHYQW
jgi:hypothetical protein